MATQVYYNWVADGRPWELAIPVAQYRLAFRNAGWGAFQVGTLGDDAHLQASVPRDHTPFSFTGWPDANPYPHVHAIDVSHRDGDHGELDVIVAQWVSDANKGLTPWVKYIVYKGRSWSVTSGWAPQEASGHYDHVHVSMRTDHTLSSIGTYNPLAGKDNDMSLLDEPLAGTPDYPGRTVREAWEDIWRDVHIEIPRRIDATIDPEALAIALAAQENFVNAVATAVASRLGMIPTAGEIARAVGELTWHGRAE